MRIRIGGRLCALAFISLAAAGSAAPLLPARHLSTGGTAQRQRPQPARLRVAQTYCTSNGSGAFVGGGAGNVAGGTDAGILAGASNQACANDDAVVAGSQNVIGDTNEVSTDSSIAGGFGNFISSGVDAFLGGGASNSIIGNVDSVIGGGTNNSIAFVGQQATGTAGSYGTIVGGYGNVISPTATNGAAYASIGGGYQNTVNATTPNGGSYAAIAGGLSNVTNARGAAIGGGENNSVGGADGVVPGGSKNVARGAGSFAAGTDSFAATNGTFVWSDRASPAKRLVSGVDNEFLVRASGGVEFFSNAGLTAGVKLAPGAKAWTSAVDEATLAMVPLDATDVLSKVEALPVGAWRYRDDPAGTLHVGPTAQAFHAAFGLGDDERRVNALDESGVALAAVSALARARTHELVERDAKIAALERRVDALAAAVAALERRGR